MFRDLVLRNRSRRRFHQDPVDMETLRDLVDLARLSASASNRQALKFYLSCDREENAKIFPLIGLAGNPGIDEAPTAYILILGDTEIGQSIGCDHGIAAQSILLGATEKGLGGCMVGMFNRDRLGEALDMPKRYQILLVLVLGKPKDTVVIDPLGDSEATRGWFDSENVRHVPKRSLDEITITHSTIATGEWESKAASERLS